MEFKPERPSSVRRKNVRASSAAQNKKSSARAAKAAAELQRGPDGHFASTRHDHRLAEIIAASAYVFAHRGYHGSSTQDIADVLKIKQASLYHYLPSKEAALEAVCERGSEGFFETAVLAAARPASAAGKIHALAQAFFLPLVDRRDFITVFHRERRHLTREARARVTKWIRAYEQLVQEIIVGGIESGEFRKDLDPRLTTLALIGMFRTVSDWYGYEPDIGIDKVIAEFPKFVLQGIVAPSHGEINSVEPLSF